MKSILLFNFFLFLYILHTTVINWYSLGANLSTAFSFSYKFKNWSVISVWLMRKRGEIFFFLFTKSRRAHEILKRLGKNSWNSYLTKERPKKKKKKLLMSDIKEENKQEHYFLSLSFLSLILSVNVRVAQFLSTASHWINEYFHSFSLSDWHIDWNHLSIFVRFL